MPQEQAAYDAALELLKAGDYKAAVTRFTKFATDWENSPYRADALYWRGSCHFALEQYKSTINVQNQLIKQYPKHSRVPDAMISVASAQASLGNVKELGVRSEIRALGTSYDVSLISEPQISKGSLVTMTEEGVASIC